MILLYPKAAPGSRLKINCTFIMNETIFKMKEITFKLGYMVLLCLKAAPGSVFTLYQVLVANGSLEKVLFVGVFQVKLGMKHRPVFSCNLHPVSDAGL